MFLLEYGIVDCMCLKAFPSGKGARVHVVVLERWKGKENGMVEEEDGKRDQRVGNRDETA